MNDQRKNCNALNINIPQDNRTLYQITKNILTDRFRLHNINRTKGNKNLKFKLFYVFINGGK